MVCGGILSFSVLLTFDDALNVAFIAVLLVALGEASHLLLRWMLELSAHLPARINFLWWIATYGSTYDVQIQQYYQRFYASSWLTKYLQYYGLRVGL